MHGHQPTSQFVGIARSYPNSVHDLLCYEDPLSDSSSTWDNYLEEASAQRRVCAMADAPNDSPPEVVPSQQTRTPSDHRAQALTNAQAHGEDLRLQWQHMPHPWTSPRGPSPGQRG